MAAIAILDGDGGELRLTGDEAVALLDVCDRFEAATVSACRDCAAKVLATVAVVDVVDGAAAHPASMRLVELADEAPTLHLYLVDLATTCQHARWSDPGYEEWCAAAGVRGRNRRRGQL